MRFQMRTESGRLSECSSAVFALVWLLARVQSLVASERRGLAERPETVLALVRPLSGVNASVCPQTPLRAKEPLALFTLPPSPILSLGEHVVEQVGRGRAWLATDVPTGAPDPVGASRGVSDGPCSEGFPRPKLRVLVLPMMFGVC